MSDVTVVTSALNFVEKNISEGLSVNAAAIQQAQYNEYQATRRASHYNHFKNSGSGDFDYDPEKYRSVAFDSADKATTFMDYLRNNGMDFVPLNQKVNGKIVIDIKWTPDLRDKIDDFKSTYDTEVENFRIQLKKLEKSSFETEEGEAAYKKQQTQALVSSFTKQMGIADPAISTVISKTIQLSNKNKRGRTQATLVGEDTVIINGKVVTDPAIRADVLNKHKKAMEKAQKVVDGGAEKKYGHRDEVQFDNELKSLGFDDKATAKLKEMGDKEFEDFFAGKEAKDTFKKVGLSEPTKEEIEKLKNDKNKLLQNKTQTQSNTEYIKRKQFQEQERRLENRDFQTYTISTDLEDLAKNVGEYQLEGLDFLIDEYSRSQIALDVLSKKQGYANYEDLAKRGTKEEVHKIEDLAGSFTLKGLEAVKKDLKVDLIGQGFGNDREKDRDALMSLNKQLLERASQAGIVLNKRGRIDTEKLKRLSAVDLQKLGISSTTRQFLVQVNEGFKHDLMRNPLVGTTQTLAFKAIGQDEETAEDLQNGIQVGKQFKNVYKISYKIANTDRGLIGKLNKTRDEALNRGRTALDNIKKRKQVTEAQKRRAERLNAKALKGTNKKYEKVKKGEDGFWNSVENKDNRILQGFTKNRKVEKTASTVTKTTKATAKATKKATKKATQAATKTAIATALAATPLAPVSGVIAEIGSRVAPYVLIFGAFGGVFGLVVGYAIIMVILVTVISLSDNIGSFVAGIIRGDDYANKSVAYNLALELENEQDTWLNENMVINASELYNDKEDIKWGGKYYNWKYYFGSISGVGILNDNITLYPFGTNVSSDYFTTLSSFNGSALNYIVANDNYLGRQADSDWSEEAKMDYISTQSGHTDNVKDILCMVDVMYDMDIEGSGNSESLTSVLSCTPYELDRDDFNKRVLSALDWATNAIASVVDTAVSWIVPSVAGKGEDTTSGWDLYEGEYTEFNYTTVKTYAETLFEASHQNLYAANLEYYSTIDKDSKINQMVAAEADVCTTPEKDKFTIGFYKSGTNYNVTPTLTNNDGVKYQLYTKSGTPGFATTVKVENAVDSDSLCIWKNFGSASNIADSFSKVASMNSSCWTKSTATKTGDTTADATWTLSDYFHYSDNIYCCSNTKCSNYKNNYADYSSKCPVCGKEGTKVTTSDGARSVVYTVTVPEDVSTKDIYSGKYTLTDSQLTKLYNGETVTINGVTIDENTKQASKNGITYQMNATGSTVKSVVNNAFEWYKTQDGSPYVYAEDNLGMGKNQGYSWSGYCDNTTISRTIASNYIPSSSLSLSNMTVEAQSVTGLDFESDLANGKITESLISATGSDYAVAGCGQVTLDASLYNTNRELYNYIRENTLGLYVVPKRDSNGNIIYKKDSNGKYLTYASGTYKGQKIPEREYSNSEFVTQIKTNSDGTKTITIHTNLYMYPTKQIVETKTTYTRNCQGHEFYYCGGHLGIENKGLVYSITNEQIAMTGVKNEDVTNPLATDFDLSAYGYDNIVGKIDSSTVNYNTIAEAVGSGKSLSVLQDVQGTFTEGLNLNVEKDADGNYVWASGYSVQINSLASRYFYRDIFDIDTNINKGYDIFPTKDYTKFEGWTADKMTQVILKYGMDWYDLYGIDIPENIGGDTLMQDDIDAIIDGVKASGYTIPDEEIMETLLKYVGRCNYSYTGTHTHALTYYMDKAHSSDASGKLLDWSCTCSAGDGNALANMMLCLNGETGNSKNFIQSANKKLLSLNDLKPLDIVVNKSSKVNFDWIKSQTNDGVTATDMCRLYDGECVIFLGMLDEDLTLSTGQVLEKDTPLILSLTGRDGIDQYGTITIRGAYSYDEYGADDFDIDNTEVFKWLENISKYGTHTYYYRYF